MAPSLQPDPAPDFNEAIHDFRSTAAVYASDLIGVTHSLGEHHARMSAVDIDCDIETLRAAMLELNAKFAAVERAHAPRTIGQIASRIRKAVET